MKLPLFSLTALTLIAASTSSGQSLIVAYPELKVTSIAPVQAGTSAFAVTVKNVGYGTAGACKLKVTFKRQNASVSFYREVNSLAPGRSQSFKFQLGSALKSGDRIDAHVDYTNVVSESNGTNNKMTKVVP